MKKIVVWIGVMLATLLAEGVRLVPVGRISCLEQGWAAQKLDDLDNTFYEVTTFDHLHDLVIATTCETVIDIFDISDPAHPTKLQSLDLSTYGAGINSVAFHDSGYVAVACEAENKQEPGSVVILTYADGLYSISMAVTAGALPDMVTAIYKEGSDLYFAVANEGEPSNDYKTDPVGSVSLLSMANGDWSAETFGFEALNGKEDSLRAEGIRIFGPGANTAQDLEPEYIVQSADRKQLVISLQENNALAIFDLDTKSFTAIKALGFKDHSLEENSLDASDKDEVINMRAYPTLGMYQPDAITGFVIGDEQYYLIANEGDARDYWFDAADEAACLDAGGLEWDEDDGCLAYSEEARGDELVLNASIPAFQEEGLQSAEKMGRLKVSTALWDTAASHLTTTSDGEVRVWDKVYNYGGRSFSLLNASGELIWDSKNQFETIIADSFPTYFNAKDENGFMDDRSDDKGPEPEAIAVGMVGEKRLCFVGLERMGGIMMYDITTTTPEFVSYTNNRDFTYQEKYKKADSTQFAALGDLGPETIQFVSQEKSPSGKPMIIVGNEISGTIALYNIDTMTVDVAHQKMHKNGLSVAALVRNSELSLSIPVEQEGHVSVELFSVNGRRVATLLDETLTAGIFSGDFGVQNIAGGIYIMQVSTATHKVIRSLKISN